MRESIRGYSDAVLEAAGARGVLGQVAGELASFAQLLAANEDLRGVLADPGLHRPTRRAVVQDLLSDRADPATSALLVFCVDADRATAFVDNVEWLVGSARRTTAGDDDYEGPLGRRASEERLDGYARGVMSEAEGRGSLSDIEDELFRFARIVGQDESLRSVLTDRTIPGPARQAVVRDLLSQRAGAATVRLASYAALVGSPRDYVALVDLLADLAAAEADRRVAEVRTAVDLSDDQKRRLAQALSQMTGRNVEVRLTADASILGGFVATVGDTIVDASVKHRLELLHEQLSVPDVAVSTGDTN